jgi:hypothetical protein
METQACSRYWKTSRANYRNGRASAVFLEDLDTVVTVIGCSLGMSIALSKKLGKMGFNNCPQSQQESPLGNLHLLDK